MDELVRPDGSAIFKRGMSWVELQYIWCTVICVIQAVYGFAPCIPTCVGVRASQTVEKAPTFLTVDQTTAEWLP